MEIITQKHSNEIERNEKLQNFSKKFHLSSILNACGAYRHKGNSTLSLFIYMVGLIFNNRSLYMDMQINQNKAFSKDTIYRFLNDARINWSKLVALLASNVIGFLKPLTDENRRNVLIIDDSTYARPKSKKVELLANVYDHAEHKYVKGFRLLTMLWSDGATSVPLLYRLMSTENKKNRICEASKCDKRSTAYKIRQEAQMKSTDLVIDMLKTAKKYSHSAHYVLFDTWFCFPDSLIKIKKLGYDVISMAKKTPKQLYCYDHQMMSLKDIYKKCKKRPGKSRYMLSVVVQITKGTEHTTAKVVYIRNRNNRKDYLCLISTDINLTEEEIIQTYAKRLNIEVFFKMCKSYLKLTSECKSVSYDAMTAHVAVVFTRYIMLAYEQRCQTDQRTMGELLFYMCQEIADISLTQALELLLSCLKDFLLSENIISETEIQKLLDKYIDTLPAEFSSGLKKCA